MDTKPAGATDAPLMVDPRIGDAVLSAIEHQTGEEVEIVLIVLRSDPALHNGGRFMASPSMVTSLHPDVAEQVVINYAGALAAKNMGERTVSGVFKAN